MTTGDITTNGIEEENQDGKGEGGKGVMRYKCDKCGGTVYVDPGEARVCDACAARMKELEIPRIVYVGSRREAACHAS